MRDGWTYRALGGICENLDKRRVPITKSDRVSGEFPYYGASGIVDYVSEYLFNEDLLLVSEDGANLLARTYPIAFSVEGKVWVNNHAHVLKFPNKESQRFMEFYLNSISLAPYVSGMAQPKLNQRSLNSISVPFPPLAEQRRIVGILDEAFDGIATAQANAELNLQNARALFESILNEIFEDPPRSWPQKSLGELSQINSGGTPLKSTKAFWERGDIPWYTSGELNTIYTSPSKKFITEKGLSQSNAKMFPKGALLMGMYDTAALKMSILDRNGTFNQAVAGMMPTEKINLLFLLYAIRHVRPEVLKLRRGVRQKNLSLAKIKAIEVRIPSTVVEQERVLEEILVMKRNSERLESLYQRKLAALDELKKSLLHQAFSGQL
ncbi:MAG: restriction endonuclease subunit S [Pirellulaceae bacterium]